MKKLICSKDVELFLEKGLKELEIEKGTIITPSAKDIIKNNEINVVIKEKKLKSNNNESIDMDKVMELFKVVSKDPVLQKAIIKMLLKEEKFQEEIDPTGFSLIKGKTVKYDKVFNNLNVYSQNLIDTDDQIVGFLKIDGDAFIKKTKSKGNLYVIEGELEILLNGRKFFIEKGDLIRVPENINLKIESKGESKLLYFSKDLNWSEPFL